MGDAGLSSRKFILLLLPFFIFLIGVTDLKAEEGERVGRYVLQSRVEEDNGSSITEVYLDRKKQRLIVKEFDREGTTAPHSEGHTERLSEAWRPAPSGWNMRKVSEFDLKDGTSQQAARQAMNRIEGDQGEQVFLRSLDQVRRGTSRFRLVQIGDRENTQVALYHNPDTGQLIFQSLNNKGARKHQFFRTAGLATDIQHLDSDQTPLDFKVMPARTFSQVQQAAREVEELMRVHGFEMPAGTMDAYLNQARAFQEGMERIELNETTSGVFEEVLYHPGTNELLFRRYTYGPNGDQQVLEERFYDLNDDVGFEAALLRFQGMNEGEERLRQLVLANGGCEKPLRTTMPLGEEGERNLGDINRVLEELWRSELQGALADQIKIENDNKFSLDLNLLGRQHTLVGNVDAQGRLVDVNFKNPQLARDKKMRIRHIRGDNGDKQFMVEAYNEYSGEWEPQLVLEGEVGFNESGQRVPRIAAYLKGRQGEGQFQFDGFEKSTYELSLQEGRLVGSGPRYRYDGRRTEDYSQISTRNQGGGGLINFAFHFFFSQNGRREKVRDTIIEEARKAVSRTNFSDLISDQDILRISEEVTEATALRTDNFGNSKNRVEAVATEEAYSRFGAFLLEKMVADLLNGEDPQKISDMVNVVMRDFRLCLRRSSQARNSDMASECMTVFMREAPIDVAKEILKLKMIEAGLGDFLAVGERDFLACTQENYDPVKSRISSQEGLKKVQGCLYKALMGTVDKVAPSIVDQKVAEISRDMNLNLTYSQDRLRQAREKSRHCLKEEGLGQYGPRGLEVNLDRLGQTGADLFEQAFMSCVNLLVEDVALSVGEVAMAAKVNELDLTDASKNRIIQDTYAPGMQGCMDRQKEAIRDLRTRYQRERAEQVARNGSDSRLNVGVIVPTFDPLECNRVLTNLATGKAMEETLISMFGEEEYRRILEKEGSDPRQCFRDLHQRNLNDVAIWIVDNEGLNEDQKRQATARRDEEMDKKSAECLSRGISMASYYVAQKTFTDKLAENPDYKNLSLSPEVLDMIGKSVQGCFNENLATVHTVDGVLEAQERLKDTCAVALLQDEEVQGPLFTPFVENALGNIEMDAETKEQVVNSIIRSLGEDLKSVTTFDQAMAKIDGFKAQAVPLVLRGVLTEKISDLTKAEGESGRNRVLSLVSRVEREVFGDNGQGPLGQQLIAAIESGNDEQVDAAIRQVEVRSAQVLGPEILRAKGEQMLAEGALDSQADVDLLVEKGSEFLNTCLENIPEGTLDPLDYCVVDTTVKTTEFILRSKLEDKLVNHPLLQNVVSEEERNQLIERLVNENRLNELKRISEMPDGPEKDRQTSDFILSFKMDATQTIFGEVLRDIIDEKLPNPRYYDERATYYLNRRKDRLAERATENVNVCVNGLKERVANSTLEAPHSIREIDLDRCLNEARLDLTKEILPKRLEFILHYLHGDLNRVRRLRNTAVEDFNSCAAKENTIQASGPYGYMLDGCLTAAINTFIGAVLQDMRDTEPVLLAGGDQQTDWEQCRRSIRTEAHGLVYGEGPISSEFTNMDESTYYARLYRDGENANPSRPPNLDWLIPQVITCVVQKLAPNMTIEFRNAFIERHKDSLDEEGKNLIVSLTEAVHKVFSTKRPNGDPILVDISGLFGRTNPETVSNEPQDGELPTVRPTPIMDLLKEFEPIVVEHINQAAAYDPEGMATAIAAFETEIQARLQATTGEEVPLDVVVDALLESDLTNIAIESMISSIIREETTKALEDEGADTSVVWLLSSKTMIRRLFGSGAGKESIERLKREYLRPLLLGQRSDFSIPNELMAGVKDVLIKDTVKGGFVETLFGPIIQNKLDEKRDWIESGWTAIFKVPVAGWKGLNRNRDFTWGNRFDPQTSPYHLRNTPSGQRAVEYFAENLLRPMLNGNLSDSAKEAASEELGSIVEEAMSENNPE